MQDSPLRFVVDTHALWWYLKYPERLPAAAGAIFRLAETGHATIIVPAIAIAELYFLSVRVNEPFSPTDLLEDLDSASGIHLSDLGRAQLEMLDAFPEIPEMHDRLIAAESMVFDAPVVTRDETLSRSSQVETVW